MRRMIFGWASFSALLIIGVLAFENPSVHAQDVTSTDYEVLAPVVTGGGGYATSDDFSLLGSISSFAHDVSSSLSFGSNPGFPAFPFVSTPIVGATGGNASASISWTAAVGVLGYSVSGYSVGQSTTSGGPYTFTSVGNVLSYSASGLSNGTTYYFVVRVLDPQGITIGTSAEVSATPAAPATPPPQNNNNNNNAGPGSIPSTEPITGAATVLFSGRAYPSSSVILLKDGQIALSTVAGGDSNFAFSLTGLAAGSYVFSVYGVDSTGTNSAPLSFPVTLTAGATTDIGGIFISPTISVNDSEVRQGDNLIIFGKSAASSTVTISVHSSPEFFVTTKSDGSGAYLYTLDTTPLDLGDHTTASKAAVANAISAFGTSVGFIVGDQTIAKTKQCMVGDLNCDGHVNLIDFSILAYWYGKVPPAAIESNLNHYGKADLVDFSIMAAHWTG